MGGSRQKEDIVAEITVDTMRIDVILKTDIFEASNIHHPLLPAAITELMICLNDLLHKCDQAQTRVSFTDHVDVTGATNDITDLVSEIRNAVCHIPSPAHRLAQSTIRFTFNTAYGKMEFHIGNEIVTSDFDDDVCFFFWGA